MHFRNRTFAGLSALLLLILALAGSTGLGRAQAAPPGPLDLPTALVPEQVRDKSATLLGAHAADATLHLLFMLPLRDRASLDAFLADVGNPRSPRYGQYLTLEQANARFNPDPAHEQAVLAWLKGAGLTQLATAPNHLYVEATASTAAVTALLGVQINDYRLPDRTFYAPDRVPVLPTSVRGAVTWITGLSNAAQIHTFSNGNPHGRPAYYAQDLANAYNANPLWDAGHTGAGSQLAITLWGNAPSDSTLNAWAATTGAAVATRANGRLVIIQENGGLHSFPDEGEAGMDIESSGSIAYGAQIRYYEGGTDSNGSPDMTSLALAVNHAGTDPVYNRMISNSWGGAEVPILTQAFENILATNAATGHTYLFSSGDDGSWSRVNGGTDPYPAYPASSAYVLSIGGTRFSGNIGAAWPGEVTWAYDPTGNNGHPEGSGGGYSLVFPRPAWEVAPGVSGTTRGYPDVAAVGDPATGYYVCYGTSGACGQIGGTSLSAPVWAGLLTIANQYIAARGGVQIGFAPPTLYALSTGQVFAAYHDVTSGTNGAYDAGAGWDAVTGLGSPDIWNLARSLGGVVEPTATPTRTRVPTATPTLASGQRFTDVPPGALFYDQINWCFDQGIISGYDNGNSTHSFRPVNNATRAQVSKMLVQASGWTINTSGGPHFRDVPTTHPQYNFVETVYHHGVISGYTCGGSCLEFRPGNNVTRAQFAKMLVQAKGWPDNSTGGPHFRDVPGSNAFYSYIETAYNHGVISGYSCGSSCLEFRPVNYITRGQLAKLIYGAYSQ